MKLNLGCGKDIKKGYVNVDRVKMPNVDYVCDFNKEPLPFKNNTFEEVYCNRVIELLDELPKTFEEIHRICKKSAKVKVIVPYYNCKGSYNDPLQKHFFNSDSLNFLTAGYETSYYTNARFLIRAKKLIPTRLGKIIPPFCREKVSLVIGEVISLIEFDLEVVK